MVPGLPAPRGVNGGDPPGPAAPSWWPHFPAHRVRWLTSRTYNLGLLASPLWGKMAEARKDYRVVFFGGFFVTFGAIGELPFTSGVPAWCLLASLAGLGTAANTGRASSCSIRPQGGMGAKNRLAAKLQRFRPGAGPAARRVFTHAVGTGLAVAAGLVLLALVVGGMGRPVGRMPHAALRTP